MPIAHLCNHRAECYRRTAARSTLGDTTGTWEARPVPDGLNCRPNQSWLGTQVEPGPGELQGTTRQWFLLPDFPVAERDALKITEGAEAGLQLRVLSVVPCHDAEGIHHLEIAGEVLVEQLP